MKKIILIFALGLFGVNAQAQDWVWAESGTGAYDNLGEGVITDASGNVYVTGIFSNPTMTFGNITLTNADTTGNNIFIVKYDGYGNAIWAKGTETIHQGFGENVVNGIAIDKEDNIYITGSFASSSLIFDTITIFNPDTISNSYSYFIAKYNSSGNALWAKSEAGGIAITCDKWNNVCVSGEAILEKYNTSGKLLWTKSTGRTGSGEGNGISVDANANIYLTGYFYGTSIAFDTFNLLNADTLQFGNTDDIFIVKYDSSGRVVWAKSTGGIKDDGATSVTTDEQGNAYLTGYFNSASITFGTDVLTNSSSIYNYGEYFIVKYDSSGKVVWAKDGGGAGGGEVGESICTDGLGNIFVTGSYDGWNGIVFDSTYLSSTSVPPGDAVFIVKYDTAGKVLGVAGSQNGYGIGSGIVTDSEGNIFVTGSYGFFFSDGSYLSPYGINFGNFAFYGSSTGADSGSSIGAEAFFIAKLDLVTGVDEINKSNNILIYPNPTNNIFYLVTNNLQGAKLNIYNVLGELIEQNTITNSNTEIDLSSVAAGVYFLQVQDGEKVYNGKVVKE